MALLEFRSPLRKLVAFFQASRDKWKEKCQQTKYELKLLKRRFENLRINRDEWQQCYLQAEIERDQLRARCEHLETQYQQVQRQLEDMAKKGGSSASFTSTAG